MVKTEGIFFGFGKSKNSQLRGEEFVGCSEVPIPSMDRMEVSIFRLPDFTILPTKKFEKK